MIASLMMYRRPELAGVHNRYWALIRQNLTEAGIDSPAELSQEAEEFNVWQHPELVLSQTCGMPYRIWLHDRVALVGTPDFNLQDCPPGYYRSAIIVRADDPRKHIEEFRDAVFAYNQTFSQSGYAAPYWHVIPEGFWFENRLHTGQHLISARAVAENRADIAALDGVSWRFMQEYEQFASALRVLQWTSPTPGLPLITAKSADPQKIFGAVERAINQLRRNDREKLGLAGIVRIPQADYLAIPNPPAD